MEITVKVSKTWQEKQYEPFNVTLEARKEISDDANMDDELKKLAANLQQDVADIFAARKEKREAYKRLADY